MIESFRRLGPFLRPFRRDIIVMFILGLALSLVGGLLPGLLQVLLLIYNGDEIATLQAHVPKFLQNTIQFQNVTKEQLILWVPLAFPVLYFFYGIIRYFHYMILNYVAEKITALIRMRLIEKIVRLNLTYYSTLERGSGGLISRVFNDTTLLQQGLNFYVDLVREPFQALIYLAIMLKLDWKLTLFALLFMPFFLLITKQVSRSLRKYGTMGRESMEDLTSVLKETVDGVRVVQSFNLEKEMERRFQSTLNEYLNTAYKIVAREQAVSPINEFVISFLVMGFAFYSISAVLYDHVNGAQFVTFLLTAGLLQAPIKKLQDAGVKIQQSIVVTERVFSILENSSQVPEAINPKPFPLNWKSIAFKDVSFNYGGEMVLKNVSLTVKRGEVIALVGESGSGKSTLVNLLERFYDPTSGEIFVDDIPLLHIDLRDLRHNIALVTQDVFLFRDSIARNIQAGDFTKTGVSAEAAAKSANAHNFISSTAKGYQSPVGERGSFLSGVEKQRVSIARAIFKDAPILILDEATSALDSVSEMEVQKGLNRLMEGRTAFVIAHRLSTVFNADRILVMKKGEIVEEGNHATLIARKGEYHNFFQMQMNHEERSRALI
jgi:subfamily B ATP-binding cassette protein MsbA